MADGDLFVKIGSKNVLFGTLDPDRLTAMARRMKQDDESLTKSEAVQAAALRLVNKSDTTSEKITPGSDEGDAIRRDLGVSRGLDRDLTPEEWADAGNVAILAEWKATQTP